MRWIHAFLTLATLHLGLALGVAEAVGPVPGPIPVESAPDEPESGDARHGTCGADVHPESPPSLVAADPAENATTSHPALAASPEVRPWPSLAGLIPALPFAIQPSAPIADLSRARGPSGWPMTAAGRLAWLSRLLF